jgi:hypothetical protein
LIYLGKGIIAFTVDYNIKNNAHQVSYFINNS